MMDVGRHPRIKTLVNSEVEDVSGFVGNFRARIRRNPRYVVAEDCNACDECAKVCPVAVPDEYQQGFSSRKAIYLPFPQAVPSAYVLDMENCLGSEPIACGRCAEVCEKNCIDFDDQGEVLDVPVGSIVVATGMKVYDPRKNDEYGYTRYDNVITSMEFERLICAGGPSAGHLVRPSDRRTPKRIGFVQCVGSRSTSRGMPYCSNICCMNTVKQTLQIHEHYADANSTVFYMDIRAFGKGFEDLYRRSRENGTRYVRGLPGNVEEDSETKDLIVTVENTTTGKLEQHQLDMLVLAVGLEPQKSNGSKTVDEVLNLSHTSDGFVLEAHPKLKPVDAPTRGIFFAGCVEAPKDVKDSVTQASAAAARANNLLGAGQVKVEAITANLDTDQCILCGLCSRVCPVNAITATNKKEKVFPSIIEAACAGCGTCAAECPTDTIAMRHFSDAQILAQVDAILAEDRMSKILTFACNWCSYAGGDMAGTSRLQYPPSVRLIRTMCSGRVDEKFIWHAFRLGAPLVLVSGCHFTDCHYIDAVTWTQKRVEKVWSRMEKLGIRPGRLQLEWISAAEGQKFARVMRELHEHLHRVTPAEVEETIRILEKQPPVPGRSKTAVAAGA
jgi:heterodisulfide reductase subunit A